MPAKATASQGAKDTLSPKGQQEPGLAHSKAITRPQGADGSDPLREGDAGGRRQEREQRERAAAGKTTPQSRGKAARLLTDGKRSRVAWVQGPRRKMQDKERRRRRPGSSGSRPEADEAPKGPPGVNPPSGQRRAGPGGLPGRTAVLSGRRARPDTSLASGGGGW